MGQELQTSEKKNEIVVTDDVLKSFLFSNGTNLTQQEQTAFFQIAKMAQLNPFKREIYVVAYGEGEKRSLSIITGFEVYLKRAERTGLLDGWKCEFFGIFRKELVNKEFRGKGGSTYFKDVEQIVETERCFARITIHRKDRKMPFEHEVELAEYNQNNQMWTSKPVTMLKKVAMSQGFRICFPDELAGLPYTSEEMPQDDSPRTPDYTVDDKQTRVPPPPTTKPEVPEAEQREKFNEFLQNASVKLDGWDRIVEVVTSFGYDEIAQVPATKFREIANAVKELLPK